jgi:uncharacterized membrane protein
MLRGLIVSTAGGETILEWIEIAALAIELIAVAIIIGAIFYSLSHYLFKSILKPEQDGLYLQLKVHLGKALLLGLEILVAADIIRTVALEATLESVIVLGLLVLIRTFLSWALIVEIEGRWPWQQKQDDQDNM